MLQRFPVLFRNIRPEDEEYLTTELCHHGKEVGSTELTELFEKSKDIEKNNITENSNGNSIKKDNDIKKDDDIGRDNDIQKDNEVNDKKQKQITEARQLLQKRWIDSRQTVLEELDEGLSLKSK